MSSLIKTAYALTAAAIATGANQTSATAAPTLSIIEQESKIIEQESKIDASVVDTGRSPSQAAKEVILAELRDVLERNRLNHSTRYKGDCFVDTDSKGFKD